MHIWVATSLVHLLLHRLDLSFLTTLRTVVVTGQFVDVNVVFRAVGSSHCNSVLEMYPLKPFDSNRKEWKVNE
jgi:hypothetical protein